LYISNIWQWYFSLRCIRWLFCWRRMVKKCISMEGNCWTMGGETWALWWCLDVLDWWWTWLLWVSPSKCHFSYIVAKPRIICSYLVEFTFIFCYTGKWYIIIIIIVAIVVEQLAEDLGALPIWVFNNGNFMFISINQVLVWLLSLKQIISILSKALSRSCQN